VISIPVFDQIEGISIYRDDEDLSRFYYLPRAPRVVVGQDGVPQFTFYRYQNPIDRGGTEKGGGYLLFTTSIAEDAQVLESRVKPRLQSLLTAEDPTNPNPPQVKLGPVQFTGGQIQLIFLKSNQFVKAVSLGRPSLAGDNTASVAVELTEDGAQLFYEGLMHGAGVAAIEYDLTYPVRLPAIQIKGHIDSHEVKTAAMGMAEEQVTDESVWGDEERTEHHRTSISETMKNQGLVKLEILKGSVDLKQEDEDALRNFAFSIMDEFVKKHFMSGGSVATAEDRKNVWTQFIHEDVTNNFDLDVTMRDVVTYQYNPNSQIGSNLLGVDPKTLVFDVDLQDAPWYHNLKVQVNTSLDWDRFGDVVHSVVGTFRYDEERDDGTRVVATDSVIFTDSDKATKLFQAHVAKVGLDSYTVDVEVNYKAGPRLQATFPAVRTSKRAYTIEVPNPGLIDIDFAVDPGVFGEKLTSIEVEVQYGDRARSVGDVTETVVLNANQTLKNYRRWIYAPFDKPIQWRTTYIIKDAAGSEQRSTSDWVAQEAAAKLYITIHSPFEDTFLLRVIPSVDWSGVSLVVVDLAYDDEANDLHQQTTVSFTKEAKATFQDWKFPLRGEGARTFRYRQTLLFTNAGRETGSWVTVTDNPGTLVVGNAPGGVVELEVDPADTDLGTSVKRAIVRLQYRDVANSVTRSATLVFHNSTTQKWSIARADSNANEYTYDVEYVMADSSHRHLGPQRGELPAGGLTDYLSLPPAPPAPVPVLPPTP
jgi:hypothetical protein